MAGLMSFGIGCGGPTTTSKPPTKTTPTTSAKKTTTNGDMKGMITVTADAKADVVKGKETKVTIKVKRDLEVKGAITLTYDPSDGLSVEGGATIPADKDETEATIKA